MLSWIGDLAAWIRTAAAVLRLTGRLVLVDLHPLFNMVDRLDPLYLDFPYLDDGPRRLEDQGGPYADPAARTVHDATVELGHSLGEVVTSAVQAGLSIEQLGEHVAVESDVGRGLLPRGPDGLLRWRRFDELLPVNLQPPGAQAGLTHDSSQSGRRVTGRDDTGPQRRLSGRDAASWVPPAPEHQELHVSSTTHRAVRAVRAC